MRSAPTLDTVRRVPGTPRPAAVRKREQPERLETDRRRLPAGGAATDRPRRSGALGDGNPRALRDDAAAARAPGGKPRRTSDSKFGNAKPRAERPRHPGERIGQVPIGDRSAGTLKPRAEGDRQTRPERSAGPRTGAAPSTRGGSDRRARNDTRPDSTRPTRSGGEPTSRSDRPAHPRATGPRNPRSDGPPRRPGGKPGAPRKGPR
jgi:23S rRNA pseudouridine2605 synthase